MQALLDEVAGHTELLVIRWALTEEYQALGHYQQQFGRLPKYVLR